MTPLRTLPRALLICCLLLAAAPGARAQSVRDHTRLDPGDRETAVTEAQAAELTLTLTAVAVRPIQVWVRVVGVVDSERKVLTARVPAMESPLVRVGQRVRAFPPESRSSMFQARVTRVTAGSDGAVLEAELAARGQEGSRWYVLEIVAEHGEFLSVPNEAILETGGARVVYVQQSPGRYAPREVQTGVQGELLTQILGGLKPGEQVVTTGSFFIDAEYKLKGS